MNYFVLFSATELKERIANWKKQKKASTSQSS